MARPITRPTIAHVVTDHPVERSIQRRQVDRAAGAAPDKGRQDGEQHPVVRPQILSIDVREPVEDSVECPRIDGLDAVTKAPTTQEDRRRYLGRLDDPLVAVADRTPPRIAGRVSGVDDSAREKSRDVVISPQPSDRRRVGRLVQPPPPGDAHPCEPLDGRDGVVRRGSRQSGGRG